MNITTESFINYFGVIDEGDIVSEEDLEELTSEERKDN